MPTTEPWRIASSGGDYTSLNAAWVARGDGQNLVTADKILKFVCESSSATPDPIIVGGIDNITVDATRYVWLYTPPANRHTGIPSTGYRMSTNGFEAAILIGVPFVKIEGLAFVVGANPNYMVSVAAAITDTTMLIQISHCLWTGGAGWGFYPLAVLGGGVGGRVHVWNCMAHDCPQGAIILNKTGVTLRAYHTTVAQSATASGVGMFQQVAGTFICKNCIAAEAGVALGTGQARCYKGTFDAASDFNLASDVPDIPFGYLGAPGTNPQNDKDPTFVNAGGNDFHLDAADTVAKDISTANLVADSDIPIADDIDGQTYPASGNVSIGADQIVAATSEGGAVGAQRRQSSMKIFGSIGGI